MPRPRFSEMLVTRRRQLGLSISQASQVLRLKEQVLIAFEEGDFDHIPKSGYAQGMLSSYARYLGLNPRQVVNQFQADLNDYVKDMQSAMPEDYDSQDTYLAPRKLLPTSGGPAGDLGAFATTSQPHSRQQSSPLVTRRYVGSLHDEQDRAYGYDVDQPYVEQTRVASAAGPAQATGYTTQHTRTASSRTRRRTSGRASSGRDKVTTRRVTSSSRAADTYDDQVIDYEPQVSRGRSGQRSVPRRRGGLVGSVISYFSDTKRLIAAVGVVVALALLVGVVFAVRSCSSKNTTDTDKTVPVTQSQTADTTGTANAAAGTTDAAADPNAQSTAAAQGNDPTATAGGAAAAEGQEGAATTTGADGKTATATTTPQKTVVDVKVEAGQVSWVEVLCDGESKIATTVTGPWSASYEVHESITIEVADPAAVVVTENGKQRQFDTKSSGIGTMTIQGTPLPETKEDETTKKDEDADSTKPEDKDEDSQQSSGFDDSEDEYLYNYDGYDIYYNAENDLYYFFDEDGNRRNAADGSVI